MVPFKRGVDHLHFDLAKRSRFLGQGRIEVRRFGAAGRLSQHRHREMFEVDHHATGHDRGMFDGVGQLADVAAPVVCLERLDRRGSEQVGRQVVSLEMPGQQRLRQRRDIVASLAKRRQMNLERVDAEEQVLAELLFADHLFEIAIRRTDDADIDDDRVVLADPADLARFQEPQQFDLH